MVPAVAALAGKRELMEYFTTRRTQILLRADVVNRLQSLPAPEVTMNVKKVNSYISILCKNTVSHDILKENPELSTSKQGPRHGIGLQVVRNIVGKYDGMMHFEVTGSEFVANIALKSA